MRNAEVAGTLRAHYARSAGDLQVLTAAPDWRTAALWGKWLSIQDLASWTAASIAAFSLGYVLRVLIKMVTVPTPGGVQLTMASGMKPIVSQLAEQMTVWFLYVVLCSLSIAAPLACLRFGKIDSADDPAIGVAQWRGIGVNQKRVPSGRSAMASAPPRSTVKPVVS